MESQIITRTTKFAAKLDAGFTGRNGAGNSTGIVIERRRDRGLHPEHTISIQPITGKGLIANCDIEIPLSSVKAVVADMLAVLHGKNVDILDETTPEKANISPVPSSALIKQQPATPVKVERITVNDAPLAKIQGSINSLRTMLQKNFCDVWTSHNLHETSSLEHQGTRFLFNSSTATIRFIYYGGIKYYDSYRNCLITLDMDELMIEDLITVIGILKTRSYIVTK